MINQKDRFMGTMLGNGADRFPFFDLEPDDDTVRLWHQQGLPKRKSVVQFFNLEDFPRMVDSDYQRPKEQWWLELRPIAKVMAKPGPVISE